MGRSKRKKRASLLDAPRAWLAELDPALLGRTGRAAAWTGALSAVALAWILGVPRLQAYASSPAASPEIDVHFLHPPAWMNGDLEAHLVLTAQQQITPDVLRRDDLVAARASLLETGWFEDIRQVRRAHDGRIEVAAEFVRPFAVIRDGQGDHLVSSSGRLLPRTVPVGHAPQFTTILGAQYRRPHRAGELWEGADVTAALRLLRLISTRAWRDQVEAIDIGRYQTEQVLTMVTDHGYPIHWGRAPGEETAGEVSTERKLYYLDYPFEHYGHIDGGHEGELDITDPRGVFGR